MTNKKKRIMWYKVQELFQKNYSKSRISRETGLDRTTVRRYLQMGEKEFHNWISNPRKMPLKLGKYTDFVRKELDSCPEYIRASV
jgi:transposase